MRRPASAVLLPRPHARRLAPAVPLPKPHAHPLRRLFASHDPSASPYSHHYKCNGKEPIVSLLCAQWDILPGNQTQRMQRGACAAVAKTGCGAQSRWMEDRWALRWSRKTAGSTRRARVNGGEQWPKSVSSARETWALRRHRISRHWGLRMSCCSISTRASRAARRST